MHTIKDPKKVLGAINKILEKRKDIYDNAPQKSNIKVKIVTERCKSEYCPFDGSSYNGKYYCRLYAWRGTIGCL